MATEGFFNGLLVRQTLRPILSLVLDRACARQPLTEVVAIAADAGVDWIQIRERALGDAALLQLAQQVAEVARSRTSSVRILVNKRVDIALAIAAEGVHLGFDAISICQARALLGPDAAIGISAHHPDEVHDGAEAGANYAHLAPIFDPKSKPASRPALGLAAIEVAARHGLPVIAQGGIEARHCASLIHAGAAGVAVTGSILMAADPAAAATRLREALDAV